MAMVSVEFADIGANLGNMLVKALAVAGAGAVGFFVTIGGLWVLGKFAFNKQLPRPVTRVVGVIGGLALAILVAGLLFKGTGGGGWGLGPGLGFGEGSGNVSDNEGPTKRTDPSTPSRSTPEKPSVTDVLASPPMRILMLGGQIKKVGDKLAYYNIQPDGPTHTFDSIKVAIRERMKGDPPLRGIVIIIQDDSVAHNHKAVKDLEEFAKDERLAVTHQLPAKP